MAKSKHLTQAEILEHMAEDEWSLWMFGVDDYALSRRPYKYPFNHIDLNAKRVLGLIDKGAIKYIGSPVYPVRYVLAGKGKK